MSKMTIKNVDFDAFQERQINAVRNLIEKQGYSDLQIHQAYRNEAPEVWIDLLIDKVRNPARAVASPPDFG